MVLTGLEFDPVNVSVDGVEYRVSAIAAEDGEVTTEVTPAEEHDRRGGRELTNRPRLHRTNRELASMTEGLDPEIRSQSHLRSRRTDSGPCRRSAPCLRVVECPSRSRCSLRVGRGGLPLSELDDACCADHGRTRPVAGRRASRNARPMPSSIRSSSRAPMPQRRSSCSQAERCRREGSMDSSGRGDRRRRSPDAQSHRSRKRCGFTLNSHSLLRVPRQPPGEPPQSSCCMKREAEGGWS